MWGILGICAALFLGIYDIMKKMSLKENAVLPVLLISVSTSALIFTPIIVGSVFYPEFFKSIHLYAPSLSWHEHGMVFIKSCIVVSSWILAFFAMKHLPLSYIAPIRATGPLWTLIGALVIFSEKLNLLQWLGLSITLCFFYLFSTTGKLEGIHFRKNKWVWFIIAATLIGAASGLYDKHIIRAVDRIAVQAWFSVYQVVIMLPIVLFLWVPGRKRTTPFQWRWSIPFIGVFLILTDYLYFFALSYPEALISVLSGIRRSGVVVTFAFAALVYKEQNIKRKAIFLAGIILGVFLMALGS